MSAAAGTRTTAGAAAGQGSGATSAKIEGLEAEIKELKTEIKDLKAEIKDTADSNEKKVKEADWRLLQKRLLGLEEDLRALSKTPAGPGGVGDVKPAATEADSKSAAAPVTPGKQVGGASATVVAFAGGTPFGVQNDALPPEYDPNESDDAAADRREFIGEVDASTAELKHLVLRPHVRAALQALLTLTTATGSSAAVNPSPAGPASPTVAMDAFSTPSHAKLLAALTDPGVSAVMSAVAADGGSGELGLEKVWCGPWTVLLLLPQLTPPPTMMGVAGDDAAVNARWFCANKKIVKANATVDVLPDGQIGIVSHKMRVPLMTQETKPPAANDTAIAADTARLLHATLVAAAKQLSVFERNARRKERKQHHFCRLPLLTTLQVARGQLSIGVYTHSRRRAAVDAADKAANAAAVAAAAAVIAAAATGKGARKARTDAQQIAATAEEAAKKEAEEAKRVRRVYLNFPPLPLSDPQRIARALAQVSALMSLAAREIVCAAVSDAAPPAAADAKLQPLGGGGGNGNGNGGSEKDPDDDSTDRSPLREGQFRSDDRGRPRRDSTDSTDSTGSRSGGNTGGAGSGATKKAALRTIVEIEPDENAPVVAAANSVSSTGGSTSAGADKQALVLKPSASQQQQQQRQRERQRHFGTELTC